VLVQEAVKFGIAGALYLAGTGRAERERDLAGRSVRTWLALAGLPATLYTVQNVASLMTYQNLEALTFNVLDQTKTLSAALSCYFVIGQRQSRMQVAALCTLVFATLVFERIVPVGLRDALRGILGARSSRGSLAGAGRRATHGVAPLLAASLISGLAGALTQRVMQGAPGGASRAGDGGRRRPAPRGTPTSSAWR